MKNFTVQLAVVIGLLVLNTHAVSAQWVRTSVNGGVVQSFAVSGSNVFAATFDHGVWRSTNSGTSWDSVGFRTTFNWSIGASGSNVFLGTLYGGAYFSTDNGTTWNAVNSGIPVNAMVSSFAVIGSNVFAGTMGGVYLSTNNGTSWTAVNNGLTHDSVLSFAVSGTNIFAGTSGGVYLSTNNGTSWAAVSSSFTIPVYSFAVSGNNLFAATAWAGNGVYLSTNNGTSWTSVGLTNDTVFDLAAIGSNIFAATSTGLFLSTNNGTNWAKCDTSFWVIGVKSVAVSGSNIIAGPRNPAPAGGVGGIWWRPLSQIVGVIKRQPQPEMIPQANLQVHILNEKESAVSIEFSLPHSDQVMMKVYDLSGHEMSTLVNKNLGSGSYSMPWNTRSLAAGCYMIRMQAGSNSIVRNVSIVR
jgi:BNR/Asp-box repeat